ncbi:MAG: hypothetical protein ACKOCO_01945 [Bacteroidota bacterium]|jgi:hypothetical protein
MIKDPNQLASLQAKAQQYREALQNTARYRMIWQEGVKANLVSWLKELAQSCNLTVEIEERMEVEGLESVIFSLGLEPSGLKEILEGNNRRDLMRQNGSLIYQQLFNGKIMALINLPYIEKYGQPQEPRSLAIFRPDEMTEEHIAAHLAEFLGDLTMWESYDDDGMQPATRIGFKS